MKKFFIVSVLGLLLGFTGCGPDCGGGPSVYELTSVDASLLMASREGMDNTTPVASDVRLHLTLDTRLISQQLPMSLPFIDAAYACSVDPPSLNDRVTKLMLTCDKPVRGFAPGQNILTSSAGVYDHSYTHIWDQDCSYLGKWLSEINYMTAVVNDVLIAFIPVGTVVPAGEYTFTLTLELKSGRNFTISIPPIAL
jgi:hypothetical protein